MQGKMSKKTITAKTVGKSMPLYRGWGEQPNCRGKW